LKYLLIHLQLDHNIPAVELLVKLRDEMDAHSASLPHSSELFAEYPSILADRSSKQWESFYAEIGDFSASNYGINPKQLETVLRVQMKIMPARDRTLPETLVLEQDFGAYFEAVRGARNLEASGASRPRALAEYGPGTLEISDPHDFCGENSNHVELSYDHRRVEWELTSPLMG
jgi:hypothetical protein